MYRYETQFRNRKRKTHQIYDQFKHDSSKAHGPILEFVESKISPYAFKKAQEQYAQKDFYGSEEIRVDGNVLGWRVYRMNTNVITDIDLVLDGETWVRIMAQLILSSD